MPSKSLEKKYNIYEWVFYINFQIIFNVFIELIRFALSGKLTFNTVKVMNNRGTHIEKKVSR